jgi:hypothetical protein
MPLSYEAKLAADLYATRILLCVFLSNIMAQQPDPDAALRRLADDGHASIDAFQLRAGGGADDFEFREEMRRGFDMLVSSISAAQHGSRPPG